MKRLLITLLIIGALTASRQSYAQTKFRSLGVSDGLPQAFVSTILQDKAGFIWVATRAGLARYDGRTFKSFVHLPYNKATIADNVIEWMMIDDRDRLWILFDNREIDVFDTRTEKVTHLLDDPAFAVFKTEQLRHNSIYADSRGNVWIKANGKGFWQCDPDKHLCKFHTAGSFGVRDMFGARKFPGYDMAFVDGDTLKATRLTKGRYHTDVIYRHNGPSPNATSLRSNGDLVMPGDSTITIYNIRNKTTRVLPKPRGKVQAAASTDRSTTYFSIGARLYKLGVNDAVSLVADQQNPNTLGIQCLFADHSGNLWAGINADGIRVLDLRLSPIGTYTYQRNFPIDIMTRLFGVPLAEIDTNYFADSYAMRYIHQKDGTTWFTNGTYPLPIPRLYRYKNGHLWLPPWQNAGPAAGKIYANTYATSASGELWGVNEEYELTYFDQRSFKITAYPAFAPKTSYGLPNGLQIDGERIFWISTERDGLYRYDQQTKKTEHYLRSETPGDLPVNTLMNIINDPRDSNVMWIASLGGGLIRFDKTTRKCTIVTTADGLPDNTIYAVFSDKNGHLWCSSNKGIFSFDPVSKQVNIFNTKDGLLEDEFNRFHSVAMPNGSLAFGGFKGYTAFDPLKLFSDDLEPATAITSVRINGSAADSGLPGSPFEQAIDSYQTITLPYDQNFLEFGFAGLEYNRPEKLRYRYTLDGYDKKWLYSNLPLATYNRLPPGSYILKLNTANTSGKWSSKVKVLKIVIRPPFWLTWWFVGLCFVVAVAAVFALIRWRMNTIREKQLQLQQKNKLELDAIELEAQALRSQMNPHFIFNCLNSIKYLIQKNDQHEAINYLTIFSKLIRSQLNNTHKEISLAEELQTCKLYLQLEELRFKNKISWDFNVADDVDLYSVMLPPLLLQPFIENAVWHGLMPKDEGGKVAVNVRNEGDFVICEIDDNGVGRLVSLAAKSFNGLEQHQSKGIQLIKQRLNLHNAINDRYGEILILDKQDDDSLPISTTILIKLKKQLE